MPKWKQQDEIVCMPNTVCCAMTTDQEEAMRIVSRHNADIDALTAERDELQRRLDEVVARLKPGPEPDRQLTNIPNHTDSDLIWSEWNRQASLHTCAVAIAEDE